MKSRKLGNKILKVFTFVIMFVVVTSTVYPFLWMIFGSLKTDAEFYSNIWGPPKEPVWQNYKDAWIDGDMGLLFLNSVISTVGTLALVLPITSLAAYSFARFKFPGRDILFYIILIGLMIPKGTLAIPIFSVIVDLGIQNTRLSMLLVFSSQQLSFGIFLLRAFFLSLPREIDEAALIDGCTPIGAFIRVILPLAKPGVSTLVVFTGMNVWNEYFMSSILVRKKNLMTLPLGLIEYLGNRTTNYQGLFAMLTIMTVPIIILYIIAQKQFISGLTAGALKG